MYHHNEHIWLDEYDLRDIGFSKIAGVDEAGRGPSFGEVVVACVMLPINHGISGIRDSKKVSKTRRPKLYIEIMEKALSVSIAMASNREIEKLNILRATEKCVYSSILNMRIPPEFVFIDGEFSLPDLVTPHACVYGADGAQIYKDQNGKRTQVGHHYENVAAASIVAKVYRDNLMETYDKIWPQYGLRNHKGYLTKEHREAIKKYGITELHRKTFSGCKEYV